MTSPLQDKNLTRDKLRRFIASARKHVPAEQVQADAATDYDWQIPHHFSPDQLVALDAFAKTLAEQVAGTFENLCQGDFKVTVNSVSQHFARSIAANISTERSEHYFPTFTTAKNNQEKCGFVGISPETALALVGHMLRDSDISKRDDKRLSELEESILMDIDIAVVEALSAAFDKNAGPAVQSSTQLVKGKWPLEFEGLDDFTSITLTANHPDGNVELVFTILSDIIEPVLGTKVKPEQTLTTEQIHDLIMQNMHDVSIQVIARFSSAFMSLGDVMNLCVGDLLLLGKKTDEPIEVLLNNRPSLRAYPAASAGKYAVVIAPPDKE
ncbi:MAG TPA: hypothetical protein HPP87_10690 [Planctomycetes bacterium]|nr:hypothetical protein [Planctomycetota bacterium]HIJ71813.1 hypothetical protein [Planctomycetota bacterium]